MIARPQRGLVLLLVGFAFFACGPSQREKTLRATFLAINSARDGFATFDTTKQKQIVDGAKTIEEGQFALASYRKDREQLVALFEGVYRTLAAAALADNAETFTAATAAAQKLTQALDDLKKAKGP